MSKISGVQDISSVAEKLRERIANSPRVSAPAVKRVDDPGICSPDCPFCGGSGWVREDVPVGHYDFGKLKTCPNVDIRVLIGDEKIGLYPDEIDGLSWDSVLPLDDSGAISAAETVKGVLARGWGWVYLYGDHGQAKSLILKIAVADAIRNKKFAGYANMAEILKNVRSAYDMTNPNAESEIRLDFWAGLSVLAIDEFERVNSTSWATEQRFLIMDERYSMALRRSGITLIASNQSPNKLDSWYRDRILDGRFHVIELRGESARLGMSEDDLF